MEKQLTADQLWVESTERLRPLGVINKLSEFCQQNKIHVKSIGCKENGEIILVPDPIHAKEDNYWHNIGVRNQ